MLQQVDLAFQSWLQGLRPKNPRAAVVDATLYEQARQSIESPLQLAIPGDDSGGAIWLFVPETRFNCRECRHPVGIDEETCPFCNAPVTEPEDEPFDHDEDGMFSDWERQYGFDPFDASDAQKDFDGDGYTNLEEYQAKTNPRDANDRPPAVKRMQLVDIQGTKFGLRFNSRVRTGSGYKFGLNYRLPSGEIRTDFVRIGDTIEGFKIESYEQKSEPAEPPAMGNVDVSELVLLAPRGDRIILIKDKAKLHVELVAILRLELRGEEQRFEVRKGDPLEVDGRAYEVINVDDRERLVVIKSADSDTNVTIRQEPGRSGM